MTGAAKAVRYRQHISGLVGRKSFYRFPALNRDSLFSDERFVCLYCADNGRNSVPTSLFGVALFLKARDKVSDERAVSRCQFDMRWKVALGIRMEKRPFVRSTPQLYWQRLILNDEASQISSYVFGGGEAVRIFEEGKKTLVVDTTHIFGKWKSDGVLWYSRSRSVEEDYLGTYREISIEGRSES